LSASLLELRDVVVRYDSRHTVLNGVSLTIQPGERVAVLGASGAGKTTLFRAINRFASIQSGSILLNGAEITHAHGRALRELRSRIGVISQRHDLVDRLSVLQNVMAGALGRWSWTHALRFLIWPSVDEIAQAAEALRHVGLEHKLRSRTSGLSGGERQRVAIARSLVQAPVLMLADEPVASLDPALSEQILELLCGLAEETHVTLLCSLHQPELAQRFFNRIVEMRAGEIVNERSGDAAGTGTRLTPSLQQGALRDRD
jgi:phosphonate transport system ATP-binding protein